MTTSDKPAAGSNRKVTSRLRSLAGVPAELARLRREVKAQHETIQELRALGGRVSELLDLVTELLLLESTKQDPKFKALVDKYLESV